MRDEGHKAEIYVLAGPNGAGKSSVLGSFLSERRVEFFNPDVAAELARRERPEWSEAEANSFAWQEGQRLLQEAITNGLRYAFETTLGGVTITGRLEAALLGGAEIRVWYVGLETVELNIARVQARVAAGGHDIPEALIRKRYDAGRVNLIRLLPRLTELRVFDNSIEGDPKEGIEPAPRLLLRCAEGTVTEMCSPLELPQWAKPIAMAALGPLTE